MHVSSAFPKISINAARIMRNAGFWLGALLLMSGAAVAGTSTYTYDSLGRLTRVVYNNGTTTTTINYSYDAAGNRTSVVTTTP